MNIFHFLVALFVRNQVDKASYKYQAANTDGRLDKMGKKFLKLSLIFLASVILLERVLTALGH